MQALGPARSPARGVASASITRTAGAVGSSLARRRSSSRLLREIGSSWPAYLYLSPALLLFLVFFIGPLFFTFWLSLLDWNLIAPSPDFVGLDNYRRVFDDRLFWITLRNTIVYTLGTVPAAVGLGLGLALLIESLRHGRSVYRFIFFVPVVTSIAIVSLIWLLMLNSQVGLINQIVRVFGLSGPNWLNDPGWALPALMAVGVWKAFGYNIVLFIAGLKTIDQQLYEAARIDGAGPLQRFWHVTWPLLSPVTFFVLIISIIGSFQVFATVQVMTRGGPNNATNVLVFNIWQQAFQFYDVGMATAIASLLFLIVLVLTVFQFRFGERSVHYN